MIQCLKLKAISCRLQNAIEILKKLMKKASREKKWGKTTLQKSIFSNSQDFNFETIPNSKHSRLDFLTHFPRSILLNEMKKKSTFHLKNIKQKQQ